MRISTANQYDATIDNIQRRQLGMSEAQTRLTSGKRVLRASDDPAAAARAERALAPELVGYTGQHRPVQIKIKLSCFFNRLTQ